MEQLCVGSAEQSDGRARQPPLQLRQRVGRDGLLDDLQPTVPTRVQPWSDRRVSASRVDEVKIRAWRRRSLRARREQPPDGVTEPADVVHVPDREVAIAEARFLRLEPAAEILSVREQVHGLAFAHDHHGVREIERERLP